MLKADCALTVMCSPQIPLTSRAHNVVQQEVDGGGERRGDGGVHLQSEAAAAVAGQELALERAPQVPGQRQLPGPQPA